MLDEAQAFIFQKWYTNEQLVGVQPQQRRLMDILKQFFQSIKNALQKIGILKTPEQVENESAKDREIQLKRVDAQRLKKEYENLRSGKLAQEASALPYEASVPFVVGQLPGNNFNQPDANFAPINKAIETANNFKKKLMGSTSAIPVEGDPNSGASVGEVIMQDLSNFARIFAHVSSIAEKSQEFKDFYNQVQNRVQYRNSIKMAADVLAEHVGKFGGIFKLQRDDVKNVQDLTILADAVGVDPKFTDLEGDNPTATISFTGKNVDEISNLYGNLGRGKPLPSWVHSDTLTMEQYNYLKSNPDILMGEQTDFALFFKDTGINRDEITITEGVREVKIKEVDGQKVDAHVDLFGDTELDFTLPEYTYTYSETNPQIAAAFAGTYYAGQHVGNEKYKSIVHNLLNTGSYKGIGEVIGIRTGRESTYDSIKEDINTFLELLNGVGRFDENNNLVEPLWTKHKGLNEAVYNQLKEDHAASLRIHNLREDTQQELTDLPFILGTHELNFKQASALVDILNTVANEKRPGYFPHLRFGDKAVAVYRKELKDNEGETILDEKTGEPKRGLMIRLESIESKMGRTFGNIPVVGDRLNRNLKEQQRQRARELRREFPEEDFIVTEFDMTLDNLRSTKHGKALMGAMGDLESLAAIFQGHVYDNRGEKIERSPESREALLDSFVEMVRDRVATSRAKTLLKPRKGYPGFITERNNDGEYFRTAFQRFIDSSSNIASSLMVEPDMLESLQVLDNVYGQNSNYSKTCLLYTSPSPRDQRGSGGGGGGWEK